MPIKIKRNPISSVMGAREICKKSIKSFAVSGGCVIIPKLSLLSDLYVYPSSANFLLCKVSNVNLEDLNIKLIKNGVFIRLFPSKSLEN